MPLRCAMGISPACILVRPTVFLGARCWQGIVLRAPRVWVLVHFYNASSAGSPCSATHAELCFFVFGRITRFAASPGWASILP